MSQIERLRKHAEAGLSKAQAADIEGCSLSIAGLALKGTDLKWADKVTHWNPVGTDYPRLSSFHHQVSRRLGELRAKYPREEVCRLTGMNVGEQKHAMETPKGYSYNWTLAQIVRIAQALGIPAIQVMDEALDAMKKGL